MIYSKIKKSTISSLLGFLLCASLSLNAQKISSENFEDKSLGNSWNIVSGNWHIADVSELRIAPAEGGYQYALCSGGPGFIRLIVHIPDSLKTRTRIQLQFYYYTYAKGPGAIMELEFHKKGMSDGLRGKRVKTILPVKGRWVPYQKIFKIPPGGNSIYIVLYETKTAASTSRRVCFDNMSITCLR